MENKTVNLLKILLKIVIISIVVEIIAFFNPLILEINLKNLLIKFGLWVIFWTVIFIFMDWKAK